MAGKWLSLFTCCASNTDKEAILVTDPFSFDKVQTTKQVSNHHRAVEISTQTELSSFDVTEEYQQRNILLQKELGKARETIALHEERLLAYSQLKIPNQTANCQSNHRLWQQRKTGVAEHMGKPLLTPGHPSLCDCCCQFIIGTNVVARGAEEICNYGQRK